MPAERAGVEPRWAREGDPGRRNGGAAQPADRNSRKPARGHPQEDPGPAWGPPGGSAEGDRQCRECSACDDGPSPPPTRRNWRYGDDFEVANRPTAGLATRRPEEPYVEQAGRLTDRTAGK